ncbi:Pre-rRNA-processing protein crb3/ipi3 [Taphrina deformans PYCC 5710]|uniref:Pre-rRNA-processing protein IPI3 n=1 Tax=Taphrina deformans (strain PYCC 5710 / ATCC 11124 / CBS 356.35 / IMI 108563 / JCM 9778 / NBRC 8474) TaxID=1097556 RepID=R4XEY8_TAPDE|nr:Pre-rRNA-processing protein crb3/ipi3 [Taphrina deformans PYCC 5710]|eukprot:CCG83036.1 Pre-rRNA-processing protein crb3/ipi3 [Taphrina deformans PYCC 5710]
MEVVVTGSNVSSANSFLTVSDVQSGSHLHTFKLCSSSDRAVALIGSALFVAQNDKAIINVYRWHKEAIDQKIIIPEKLETLACSRDGTWLLGGASSGKIYLWETASGNLVFVKDAHYQSVAACAFSDDGFTFVTGSADTTVQIWKLTDVLDPYTSQELIKPRLTLTNHTLSIVDLHIGAGTSVSARLYTASTDQTVRIWDLATGELLSTLLFPLPVTCLAVDSAERHLYAGTSAGIIHEVKLYKQDKVISVIGDMGAIVTVGQSDEGALMGHESAISSLSLSLDGSLLTSGAGDGQVFVWDVSTKQMVRKLKNQPGPISLLFSTIRPTEEAIVSKSSNNQFQPLKRAQTERDRDEHSVHIKLTHSTRTSKFRPPTDIEAARAGLTHLKGPTTTSDPVAQETIVKLQDELRKLYGTYSELRTKHERLTKDYIATQL